MVVTSPLVLETNKWLLVLSWQFPRAGWEPSSSAMLLHLVFLAFQHNERACTLLHVSKQYPSPCYGSGRRAKQGYSQPLSSGDRRRMLEGDSWGCSEAWTLFLQLESGCLDSMLLSGLHGIGSQQLTGETQGCSPATQQYLATPACKWVCSPLPARLNIAFTLPELPVSGRTSFSVSLNSLNASSRPATPGI